MEEEGRKEEGRTDERKESDMASVCGVGPSVASVRRSIRSPPPSPTEIALAPHYAAQP